MTSLEVLCVHCRCVVATMTGEWDHDPIGDVRMVCEHCARCDQAPPSKPLLEAVLERRRQ